MAVAFTDQAGPSFNSTASASSYVGPAWTPPNGAVILAWVGNSKGSGAEEPTSVTTPTLTFTKITTQTFDTAATADKRWTAYRLLIGVGIAEAITVAFSANQTGCVLLVQSVTGSVVTGANAADAIVQSPTFYQDTTHNTGFVGMTTFLNHSNAVIAGYAVAGADTIVVQPGFTLGTRQAYTVPSLTANCQWLVTPDSLPTVTWTSDFKWGAIALEIAVLVPAASATSVSRGPFVGAVTATAAKFVTVLDSGGNFTFKYGTDPGLAGATTVAQTANASTGFATITSVAGLTAATKYYYQAVGDVTSSLIHSFTTLASAPTTLRLGLLSDFQQMVNPPSTPPGTAFVSLDADTPDLVLIGGDFDHSDPGQGTVEPITARTNTRAMWNRLYDGQAYGGPPYSMPDFVASILRKYPTAHVWDDHDFDSNNSNINYKWKDVVAKAEYQRFYPSYTLPSIAGGIWQSTAIGTLVELFLLDSRSQRDANTDADNASKSILDGDALGATGQKQWLKDGLLASAATWKVILSPITWNLTAQKGTTSFDNWYGAQTEQRELIAYIRDNRIRNVVILSGDVHMGGIDNGANSIVPEIVVPPPNFVSGGGEGFNNLDVVGTWTGGIWAANGYGLLTITATTLTVQIKDVNGAVQLSDTLAVFGPRGPETTVLRRRRR